jgi:hypothetical protein
MMTLGRPVPMQQPRNVRFGILIYLHAHDKWNMRPLSSLTRQKAEMRIVSGENLLTSVEIILPRSSQDEEEKYDENNDCR